MTKIYIYCLFEKDDKFCGVYSSIKAAHRDALKICNKGGASVYLRTGETVEKPTVKLLRNIFKGEMDLKVTYHSDKTSVTILKTKLKE